MERPQTTGISGQTLAAHLRGGRLPHAMLIEGPSGSGTESFAREAARGVVCSADLPGRPCGICRDCIKAEKEIHPDILLYGGEGGARSFHIDTVRQIRQQAYIRPNEAAAKALILKDVQDMSVQAQNALLKIIEEPPPNVTFLLTCENKAALLETILSRVTVFSLEGNAREDSKAAAQADEQAAEILYNAALGSELEALAALTAYERDRQGMAALLERMAALLSDAMLHGHGEARVKSLLSRAGLLRSMKILAIIEDAASAATRNAGGLLLTTTFCARLRGLMAEG